ncbi:SusC/RagA family TonB-linked outer membrane protein [Chitinophaga flava]|uniref:SusC/RagA family TonB-linked outer membrane protein n=1 Tax=Chitinophaga flava TaxID=2259036 RepID=A0A365XQD2_9BACT|nr:TonB-dependent receptor [Chitinophaga flava]RBL88562.1 SusC/RagA family TonB-linked outer membrane protein [Chitinophaga flava]
MKKRFLFLLCSAFASLLLLVPGKVPAQLLAAANITSLHMPAADAFANNVFKKEVRGQVTDTAGSPMPGVTVLVKNSPNIGTTTDMNGRYILEVPDNTTVMVFTMVGYTTQEVALNGRSVINVQLKNSASQLSETVVVAYGKQKKASVIGSITTINPGELKVPSSNLTTALAGRLAGVIAYQRSGEPGMDNAEFFIRGATTFGYKKSPLILIDGIEYDVTELARLNTDDIASFSIMKDATANALYGARGANGVILVTTKEGKEGKAKLNLRLENSISSPTRDLQLADPITYMEQNNEAVLTRNPLAPVIYSQSQIDNTKAGTNKDVYPTTNWKEMLFKKQTVNKRANFNLGGGGQIATYFVSGGYTKDNGILNVDGRNNFNNNIDLTTYTLRSNVNIRVTKSTSAMVRLHGTFDEYKGPVDGGEKLYQKMIWSNQVLFPAVYPADDAHQFVTHPLFGNFNNGEYLNPYADMVKGYKQYSRSLMLAQFEIKQDLSSFITKGLSVRAMMNTNRQAYFDVSRQYIPFWYSATNYDKLNNTYVLRDINPDQGTDYLNYVPGKRTVASTFYLESAVDYNRTFDKHGLAGMLIFIARNNLQTIDDNSSNVNLLQKSLPSRNLGLSGRATYSYDNRFFGEFNFGYNGSERFYKTERYGFFPSAGIAWFVSNENFFKPLEHVVNKLKVRANYGLVGNDAIGNEDDRFFYLSNVNMNDSKKGATFGTNGGYSRNGISIGRYDNQAITWETAKNSTFGLEVSLFNKLDIIAEYFFEQRYNILMDRASTPKTMGLQATPKANVGKAESNAFDFTADYNSNIGKNLFVTLRANFTYARNKFKAYEEPRYDEAYRYHVGYPISQRWGYIAERLFIDDEEVRSSPQQAFGNFKTMGGDIKYRDVNGDGQITPSDMVPIGFPTMPEIIYGFGFSAKYKGVDFSAFFQGSARSSFWIDVQATSPFINNSEDKSVIGETQLLKAYADSHWSEENRDLYALWPRLSPVLNTNSMQTSTWFMRNGAFLRLKQVELGYTLPTSLTRRLHMSNLRVYANATNLLTFSKFKLWDIEMGGKGLGYPIQRVVNFGLMVGF